MASADERLEPLTRPTLSICCYRYRAPNAGESELDDLNTEIAQRLRMEGIVPSTTLVAGKYAIRYKMFYLLPYPVAVLSAGALGSICGRLEEFRPYRFASLPLAVAVAALVLLGALRGWPAELRTHQSRLRESINECGLWVKSHLPSACVDYNLSRWENYWIHVEILGNPRGWSRTDSILHGEIASDLPYVIGDFPRGWPGELHRCGLVAVLQRAQTPSCPAQPTPIDQLTLPPRRGTLAAALKSLAGRL